MCGIVAIISPSMTADLSILRKMRDSLVHRGPDGHGEYLSESRNVALGHRRLSVVDTSRGGSQPMQSPDGRYQLVFNGEIYNYKSIRATLESKGVQFRSQSDTEVLLRALIAWGPDFISQLNGMFAFALWDSSEQTLLVARDRFGEKPLFMSRTKSGDVLFASEMKAILCHPGVNQEPNDEALESFVAEKWDEAGSSTFFAAVERVQPGIWSVFSGSGTKILSSRFWDASKIEIQSDLGQVEAAEGLAERLEESVKLRLSADVQVGFSLSGGLDSSVIGAIVAKEQTGLDVKTPSFSAVFPDDPTLSEEAEIDRVARAIGTTPYKVSPRALDLAIESRKLHWHQEEPFESASIYLQWCVSRLASQSGTTVLLEGQGADELLGGYPFYFASFQRDLIRRGDWRGAQIQALKINKRLHVAAKGYSDSKRRFSNTAGLNFSSFMLEMAKSRLGSRRVDDLDSNLFREARLSSLNGRGLPALLRYADRNSMAFSREVRLPYLDIHVADFSLAIPDEILLQDGWHKAPLRHASNGHIPAETSWRVDKVGYAAPLDRWLRGELKSWASSAIFSENIMDRFSRHQKHIENIWMSHQSGLSNNSWEIWKWISIFEWLSLMDAGAWSQGVAPE